MIPSEIVSTQQHILEIAPYDRGSVMVCGCVSHNCKFDFVKVEGVLNLLKNQRYILSRAVVPYCEYPLATRHIIMNNSARHHCTVMDYLQHNGITTLPSFVQSPFMELSKRQREPSVQPLWELQAPMHREWQQIPQLTTYHQTLRHITQGMCRGVATCGIYTTHSFWHWITVPKLSNVSFPG